MLSEQCVILVGGLGSRLGPLTREIPKPLLPVDGAPFVDVLIGEAIRRGFRDIVLLAGHRANVVENYASGLRSRIPADCSVRVSLETEPLGTGGALARARPLLVETFLLLNGDTWFDFNWLDLMLLAKGCSAVAARKVARSDRYEALDLGRGDRVIRIVPRSRSEGAAFVNGGVYSFRKSDLDGFGDRFSVESDLLPALIERDQLKGRAYDGFFLDIGVPETFQFAQAAVPRRRRRPAIFFDRDGVLNHNDGYVSTTERFRWIDGAKRAVRLANELGYYVFVVTNQAGVARDFYTEEDVCALHKWMAGQLREEGAAIDDWRYCPFHPDGVNKAYRSAHSWRKPEPGMLLDILDSWPVHRERSLLVGDNESDCAAARAAGIAPVLFGGGNLYDFIATRLHPLAERKQFTLQGRA